MFMSEYFLIFSLIIIALFLILIDHEKFIISFVILTLLAFPFDNSTGLRTLIQVIDYILLLYLFFKRIRIRFQKVPHHSKACGFATDVIIWIYAAFNGIFKVSSSWYPGCFEINCIFHYGLSLLWTHKDPA